jgi:NAD(P)-dependent dehydrogenase (short-subunit alcohol dehydrogenase family)
LGNLIDHPPDLRVIDVNLTGTLYSVYLALAHFRAQEPDAQSGWCGKFVATASTAGLYSFPVDTLYATSKSGP